MVLATPSASSQTLPAWSRPSAVNRPGLSVSKASVCAARTACSPKRWPVSPHRPVGRSTASTGARPALSCCTASAMAPSGARHPPRPNSASMARSVGCISKPVLPGLMLMLTPACWAWASACCASAGWRVASPSKLTCTASPWACSQRAATRPSPPLLPGPAATQIRRACGATASASRARPRPARSIRVCWGWPARACASMRRLLTASHSGHRCRDGSTGWGPAAGGVFCWGRRGRGIAAGLQVLPPRFLALVERCHCVLRRGDGLAVCWRCAGDGLAPPLVGPPPGSNALSSPPAPAPCWPWAPPSRRRNSSSESALTALAALAARPAPIARWAA